MVCKATRCSWVALSGQGTYFCLPPGSCGTFPPFASCFFFVLPPLFLHDPFCVFFVLPPLFPHNSFCLFFVLPPLFLHDPFCVFFVLPPLFLQDPFCVFFVLPTLFPHCPSPVLVSSIPLGVLGVGTWSRDETVRVNEREIVICGFPKRVLGFAS